MSESFRYLGRFFDFNMSNHQHMSELSSLVQDLMNDIDIKPLHPKHKLLLYSRYVLSKLSWHFTIANISKTWITEHLDSVVNGYIRKWLDIPISGTLSNVFLERNKFGLNICPPSIKCTQCQTVFRNSLEESPSDSFKDFHILRHDERHWHWQNAATARILSYVLNRIIIESVIFNGVESTSIKRSP